MKDVLSAFYWFALCVCLAAGLLNPQACKPLLPTGGAAATGGTEPTGGAEPTGGLGSTGGASADAAVEAGPPVCDERVVKGAPRWREPIVRPLGLLQPGALKRTKAALGTAPTTILPVWWEATDLYTTDQLSRPWCVGYAWDISLATVRWGAHATDQGAEAIYQLATRLDPFAGDYPEVDEGTTTLAGAQATRQLGRIKGYLEARTVGEVLQHLQVAPVVVGTYWLDGMFQTDDCGRLNVSGPVVGAHAYTLEGYVPKGEWLWFRNSWGARFGGCDSRGRCGHMAMTRQEFEGLWERGGEAFRAE